MELYFLIVCFGILLLNESKLQTLTSIYLNQSLASFDSVIIICIWILSLIDYLDDFLRVSRHFTESPNLNLKQKQKNNYYHGSIMVVYKLCGFISYIR